MYDIMEPTRHLKIHGWIFVNHFYRWCTQNTPEYSLKWARIKKWETHHLGFSDRAGWVPDDSDSHWFQWIWGYPKPKPVALDTAQRAATGHEVSSLGHGGAGDGQRDGRSWAGGPWGSMEKGFGENMREKYGQCPPSYHPKYPKSWFVGNWWWRLRFGMIWRYTPFPDTHPFGFASNMGKNTFFRWFFSGCFIVFSMNIAILGDPSFSAPSHLGMGQFFFGSRKSHSWASQFLAILLWGVWALSRSREVVIVMQQR